MKPQMNKPKNISTNHRMPISVDVDSFFFKYGGIVSFPMFYNT